MYQQIEQFKNDLNKLKNEFHKFLKNYEDTINNLDTDNFSEGFLQQLGISNSSGSKFEIKNTESNSPGIYLNGKLLGYLYNGVFYASGTWDFSKANKIE